MDSDNYKPTQLPRVTSLNDSDLFIVSIDVGTAPKTRAIEKSNVTNELYNYLINGGFPLAERQAPGTLTTIVDKKYGADRWQVSAENSSWQYQRLDATGISGLNSKYYGAWKKITNTGKGIFCQKIEGINCIPLHGKTITFKIKLAASSSKTIKIALLELQNAASIDTYPAALASSFGANTVNPTWGTNVAVIGSVASCSVTTSISSFYVTGTVPTNSKGVAVAIWTDSQFAANDILYTAEAAVIISSAPHAWKERLLAEEKILAQRYYEKSYNQDVLPGTASVAAGNASNVAVLAQYILGWSFLVSKRIAPAVTIWSYAGTAAKVSLFDSAADTGTVVTANGIGENAVYYLADSGSGLTVGKGYSWHWAAEAEIP